MVPHACAALQDFTDSAILAYECGYHEADVRRALQAATLAGLTPDRFSEDLYLSGCLTFLHIVFVTLTICPRKVTRWAKGGGEGGALHIVFATFVICPRKVTRWAKGGGVVSSRHMPSTLMG